MSTTLGAAMRTETLRMLEDIAFDPRRRLPRPVRHDDTFVNAELAKLYGAAAADRHAASRDDAAGDGPRAGLLGKAASSR